MLVVIAYVEFHLRCRCALLMLVVMKIDCSTGKHNDRLMMELHRTTANQGIEIKPQIICSVHATFFSHQGSAPVHQFYTRSPLHPQVLRARRAGERLGPSAAAIHCYQSQLLNWEAL